MSTIVEVDESGTLALPAAILPRSVPHTQYVASVQGQQIVLCPAGPTEPFWKKATPEEWAEDFVRWSKSHGPGPGLPADAVGRDGIYE
jgi:hypothetical protein